MNESTDRPLHERIASLEARVAELQEQVDHLQRQAPAGAPKRPVRPPSHVMEKEIERPAFRPSPRAPRDRAARVQSVLKSEDWLNKIGIALLLFGLAFLFKLGIDRGLLTPTVRVVFGVALGVFLLGAGLRLRPKRLRLGQVLIGGGIATFYVTLFAAYQFYGLVSYPMAYTGMGVVTLLGFVLAVQQNDAALAVIATVGGLITPFLLHTDESNIPALVVYTCLILSSAGGIFLYRGWRTLLLTSVVGGWLVFMVPWFEWIFDGPGTFIERAAFQAGLGFCLLAFGVLPVVREVWRHGDPERWASPALKAFANIDFIDRPARLLAVVAPLVTLGLSRGVWDLPEVVWGLIEMGVAGLYVAAYVQLRERELTPLASAHAVVAATLVAIGWFEVFEAPELRLLALTLEAVLIHVLARPLSDRSVRLIGHVVFTVLALWMTQRLLDLDGEVPALVNIQALADLAVLALVFGAAWTFRSTKVAAVYGLAAYVGLLGWFWRDLAALPNGQAYVSIAWGLSALALLAQGWRRDADLIRNTGLVTLLVVVAKLFIVDLSELEAVWRILLFLGFGGLLLLLSYFFPRLWNPDAEPDGEEGG